MNRPSHRLGRRRVWVLAILVIALAAGHGVALYYVSSRLKLTVGLLAGAVVLLLLRHAALVRSPPKPSPPAPGDPGRIDPRP